MAEPKMFYFGPWDQVGHYMRSDVWPSTDLEERRAVSGFVYKNPWGAKVDGGLCPEDRREGYALIHHKDGWTALSFWDCTVDTRPGSNSTYLAEGTYTFDEMVALAKTRFTERWNKMGFKVYERATTRSLFGAKEG